MAKHTKGPWTWRKDDKQSGEYQECHLGLDGPNGCDVLVLEDTYRGYPECGEELRIWVSREDARLIAAAPELLEALRHAVEIAEGKIEGESWDDLIEYRSLIAKAEGRDA